MIKMYTGLHVKCLLSLSYFNEIWIFLTDFQKILKCKMSWKSVQRELNCSMRTDVQTWRSYYSLFTILGKLTTDLKIFKKNYPGVELSWPWKIIYESKNTPAQFVWYSFRVISILSVRSSFLLSTLACLFLPSFINIFKSSPVPRRAFELTTFQHNFRLHPWVYKISKPVTASRNFFPFFPHWFC